MTIDWLLVAASFGIGIVVGLTGMGGGALMTPVLVLVFGIPPLTAVSSDLVAAAVMKPVGSIVHLRRGTVNLSLVKWLCVGSVPMAFLGVILVKSLGTDAAVQHTIQLALGVALLIAAFGLAFRAYTRLLERARRRDGRGEPLPQERPQVEIRRLPTIVVGALGGLVVGMTSVGSGSLIIIALMALYPVLKASQLVGTDLMQAVPLVAAAAVAHALLEGMQLLLGWEPIMERGNIIGLYDVTGGGAISLEPGGQFGDLGLGLGQGAAPEIELRLGPGLNVLTALQYAYNGAGRNTNDGYIINHFGTAGNRDYFELSGALARYVRPDQSVGLMFTDSIRNYWAAYYTKDFRQSMLSHETMPGDDENLPDVETNMVVVDDVAEVRDTAGPTTPV